MEFDYSTETSVFSGLKTQEKKCFVCNKDFIEGDLVGLIFAKYDGSTSAKQCCETCFRMGKELQVTREVRGLAKWTKKVRINRNPLRYTGKILNRKYKEIFELDFDSYYDCLNALFTYTADYENELLWVKVMDNDISRPVYHKLSALI